MFKLRFVFSILIVAILLPFTGNALVMASQSTMSNVLPAKNFVNLYIDQIKILGNAGDINGPGEFRLIILASDKKGNSTGMFCPGNAPRKVRKGDTVNSPCLAWLSFDEATVSDGVYITIMAVDEDKSSLPSDLSYDVLSAALGKAVTSKSIIGGLAKSTPFTFAAEVLISFLAGKAKEWIERADILGSQGIYLSRKDNWSADKQTTVTSSDGWIRITYTVVRTSSGPTDPKAPFIPSTPSAKTPSPGATPGSGQQPSTPKYWCDDLSRVKLKVGDSAKVVWMKVNLRSAPIVPMEFYENSLAKLDEGTKLTIIGGPACSHEGTWWQVRTSNGLIGWMREYISTGYLIGK